MSGYWCCHWQVVSEFSPYSVRNLIKNDKKDQKVTRLLPSVWFCAKTDSYDAEGGWWCNREDRQGLVKRGISREPTHSWWLDVGRETESGLQMWVYTSSVLWLVGISRRSCANDQGGMFGRTLAHGCLFSSVELQSRTPCWLGSLGPCMGTRPSWSSGLPKLGTFPCYGWTDITKLGNTQFTIWWILHWAPKE